MLTSEQEDVSGEYPNTSDAFFTHCSLIVTSILAICTLICFGSFSVLIQAQEQPLLEIRVVPQAEYAVAGQVFTYTIVLTNVGQMPVQQIIVYAETPTRTTFAKAGYKANWFISEPATGESGFVGWASRNPVAPGAVVNFELVVNVLSEMANQRLVSGQYGVGLMGGDDIIASGAAVEVDVLATVPIPTVTPTATNTATSVPKATKTATAPAPMATLSETPTPQPPATATKMMTTMPAPVSSNHTTNSSLKIMLVGGGFLILLIPVIGLIWFRKQRQS